MKFRTLTALLSLVMLTACGTSQSLETLRTTPATGDTYQIALANNYKDYAEELAIRYDWQLADYFAAKGLYVATKDIADPEDPKDWGFEGETLQQLTDLRAQLIKAVATNRTTQPELAASAVIAYDRWLALKEEGTKTKAIAEQHDVFVALLTKLQEAHVASDPATIPPPTVPAESERTVLYFPFDSDRLGDSALAALKQLIQTIPNTDDVAIAINGHADRVGSEAYNMKLSERRAIFVQKALAKAGIPTTRMQHFAFGETDPAVPTADGVEEPKNRRVEITVE